MKHAIFQLEIHLSELLPCTKKPHGTSARNEVDVGRIEIQRGLVPRRLKASIRFVVIEASPNLETISPSIPRIPFELV